MNWHSTLRTSSWWLTTCSGKTLTIKAKGNIHQKIDKGAYVLLQVKYGLITLIKQQADLCEQIVNVDLKCPLEEGEMSLVKQVELPSHIPPVCCTADHLPLPCLPSIDN